MAKPRSPRKADAVPASSADASPQATPPYRLLFEASPEPMWVLDADTLQFLDVNPAAVAKYGYAREEFLSMTLSRINPSPEVSRRVREAKEARESIRAGRWTHRLKDGREIEVEVVAHPLQMNGRKAMMACIQDVTELHRAEEAARVMKERLGTVVANAPIVLFATDARGVFTLSEGKGLELLNLHPGEMVGRSAFEVYEDVPQVGSNLRRALAGEEFAASVEVSGILWDAHYAPLRGPGGAVSGVIGVAADGTARKRAEHLLHQQSAAIRASMDGMAILDAEGRYVFLNEAHAKAYGYASASELVGKTWRVLYGPQELERFERGIMPLLWKEGQWHGEAVGRRRDGTAFPQELSLTAIEGGGLVCVVRDVSGRKAAEGERERLLATEKLARAEAELASRAKDEFLAMISHELRTPMTAMLGWTWLLKAGSLDEANYGRAIDIIERNMKLQAQIIEDLLDVSSIVTGKLRLDARLVDLAPIVSAAVDVVRPSADARSIALEVLLQPDTGAVMGDPDRLQQVVWNLLANAVKFTPEGGRVTLRLYGAGSHVGVSVTDTGQGIPDDFLPYVFDRFRQAESAITRSHRGLGLGLAIVRHMMELHGGTVHASSAGPGKGATFTISLPVAANRASAAPSGGARERLRPDALPSLSGVRVLVVDDEPDTRAMISAVLEQCGAEATAVSSAVEALAELKARKPDVLLSDIAMPGMDGYELIRKIRALPVELGGGVAAAALTACAKADDRARVLLAGYQIHIPKPVEPAELAAVVGNLTGRLQR